MKIAPLMIIPLFLLSNIMQKTNADEADRMKWNKRYNTEEYIYGKAPLMFLEENIDILTKGKALVLAMGEGRNAVFLARKTAFLPSPIARTSALPFVKMSIFSSRNINGAFP